MECCGYTPLLALATGQNRHAPPRNIDNMGHWQHGHVFVAGAWFVRKWIPFAEEEIDTLPMRYRPAFSPVSFYIIVEDTVRHVILALEIKMAPTALSHSLGCRPPPSKVAWRLPSM